MLDLQAYYKKLADNDAISADEIVVLLKELAHFRGALGYLASCQAATLASLPKATSKSALGRHIAICEVAAALLDGDGSKVKYPANLEDARDRCLRAAELRKTPGEKHECQ